MSKVIDIQEILKIIPHRYPFLLIDRVLELEDNKRILGIKNVTVNEPQFTGHFPDRPVMPGVLIIEAMAQIAAILIAKSMDTTKDKEVYFMGVSDTKFRKVVEPGDTLMIEANLTQNRGAVWKFTANAKVDGKIAAEGSFTAMVKDKK